MWDKSLCKRLSKVRERESDCYYTLMSTIEEEMKWIDPEIFRGKIVYCPADGPDSNFYKWFRQNFERLHLKSLICSCYNPHGFGRFLEMTNPAEEHWQELILDNGDLLGIRADSFLRKADIIVTNPPFSRARQFLEKVLRSGKQFLLLGSFFQATYVEIFPFLKAGKLKIHVGKDSKWLFRMSDRYTMTAEDEKEKAKHGFDFNVGKVNNCCWLLNLPSHKPPCPLELKTKAENEAEGIIYQWYANYPKAMEIPKTKLIPKDFGGLMGVPISFLQWHDPRRFELVSCLHLLLRYNNQGKAKIFDASGKQVGTKHISNMFLPVPDDWDGPYYTLPFYEGKCRQAFNRLFIRNK